MGRSGSRQGISGQVAPVPGVTPYESGLLTVALGGASRLATFVQHAPFYTAQNVAVLRPRAEMSLEQKLYWATCIRANRFRYEGFGREANRTLATLELPDETPAWLNPVPVVESLVNQVPVITADHQPNNHPGGTVGELFDIRYGQSLELNRLSRVTPPEGVNFVSRTDRNNGVSARVEAPAGVVLGQPGELTVALGGSPLATFLQPEPFLCGRDVAILKPKIEMTDAEKLYWAMCIKANRYRFSYGRQANRTLSSLKLPTMPAALTSARTIDGILSLVRSELEGTARDLRP
ncbi:hypothetical protein J2S98_003835 [Arthrobacter oryzae]|nr:hypothetical protein [Arthrobacter oryzae]